jgi:hypothetical protein
MIWSKATNRIAGLPPIFTRKQFEMSGDPVNEIFPTLPLLVVTVVS